MKLMIETTYCDTFGMIPGAILSEICNNYVQIKAFEPYDCLLEDEYWAMFSLKGLNYYLPFLREDEIEAVIVFLLGNCNGQIRYKKINVDGVETHCFLPSQKLLNYGGY